MASRRSQHPWGADGSMAVAAFRYCLGRMTYITGDCADWLVENWDDIPSHAQTQIVRELEAAFANDDRARASSDSSRAIYPLGWDCDRAEWERVRKLWRPE